MPREYVAVDLETTGLDADKDAIIEVGAVRFSESGVVDRYSSLINPERSVPAKILHLTGLDPAALRGAPAAREIIPRLAQFVGRDPIIGHSVGFDAAFLARQGALTRNRKIDTFELSTILLPHMARHSLQHLVGALDLASDSAHRALDDAEAAMRLFLALREAALALPIRLVEEVAALGHRSGWVQAGFFEDIVREQARRPAANSIAQQLIAKGIGGAGTLFASREPEPPPRPEPVRPIQPLDSEALRREIEPGGRVAQAMEAFEDRPQQAIMLEAVAKAFSEGGHLAVEAATGVGKSMAYLLPALVFAEANHERVVISTHTINLQEQLFSKDVPQLCSILGLETDVALLKGRNNYLCPARLQTLANRTSLTPEQALALAKILVWVPSTATGDKAELFLNTPPERHAWQQVSSDMAWCNGDSCRYRAGGRCFYQQARARAQAASLVIVNHSLLTMDACMETASLPEYDHLVVDEAHQFEGACTQSLRLELTLSMLRETLQSMDSGDGGALSQLQERARRLKARGAGLLTDCQSLDGAMGTARAHIDAAARVLDGSARELLGQSAARGRSYIQQLRLTGEDRSSSAWQEFIQAWQPVSEQCSRVARLVDEVRRQAESGGLGTEAESSLQALAAGGRLLREQASAFDEVVLSPSPESVYWIASQDAGVALNRAPISVAEALHETLFSRKRSVVLTSATLSTAGSFQYLKSQLGLDDCATLSVGSPFDYRRSTLVCIARDIPEPRNQGHQRAVEQAILELARATGGRLMALFTSNSQLRQTTKALAAPLEEDGILVYSQSDGGGRNQLLEGFKSTERAVLLGTRSFWQGVDVPGDALQCLVMVKLPFMVPDDPIVSARGEQYTDSFSEYLLPEAVLTFRQGFGRLIRTKTDRGVFVILDSRVRGKGYGSTFLQSLPDCTFMEGPASAIPEQALMWLSRGDSE